MASITDRLSGRIDHGFYGTIRAVAQHLGITYDRAQKALRSEYVAGNLMRAHTGRRLLYTSRQQTLQLPAKSAKAQRRGGPRKARSPKVDNQEKLF